MTRPFVWALAALLAGSMPAASAVVTTGCAGADSCTLDELFGGGTIQIDDVLFDGFFAGSNFGVDTGAVTVTGSSFSGDALLGFSFAPALEVSEGSVAEFDFDYAASVVAPSTRQIDGASLDLLGAGFNGTLSFVEANADIGGELLSVSLAAGGGSPSDFAALAPQSLFSIETDFQIEADDTGSASLSQFLLTLSLTDPEQEPGVVPLPTGAPLLVAGLGALTLLRRRGRNP